MTEITAKELFSTEMRDLALTVTEISLEHANLSTVTLGEKSHNHLILSKLYNLLSINIELNRRFTDLFNNMMSIYDSTVEEGRAYFQHASRVAWESSNGAMPTSQMSLHLHKIAAGIQEDALKRAEGIETILEHIRTGKELALGEFQFILGVLYSDQKDFSIEDMQSNLEQSSTIYSRTIDALEITVHKHSLELDEHRLNTDQECLHSESFLEGTVNYYEESLQSIMSRLKMM